MRGPARTLLVVCVMVAACSDGEQPPTDELRNVVPLADDELLYTSAADSVQACNGDGPDHNIKVMSRDGLRYRDLTDDPIKLAAINTSDEEMWSRLSPDRKRFVFYRVPRGNTGEQCRYWPQELWIANVDGTGVRSVMSSQLRAEIGRQLGWDTSIMLAGHADWSPNGRDLVINIGAVPKAVVPFIGEVPDLQHGETQIIVFDVDSGPWRLVTERVDASGFGQTGDPSFHPDGEHIVFVGCPDDQPAGCDSPTIRSVRADADRATVTTLVYETGGKGANDAYVSPDGTRLLWIEPDIFTPRMFVAPFSLGEQIVPEERIEIGPAWVGNWMHDDSGIIYNNVLTMYRNDLDGQPSRQISPTTGTASYILPSP